MEFWLLVVIGVLLIIILGLLIKLLLVQKTAREIQEAFAERLTIETNTLIDISYRDKTMLKLANGLNTELRKLRSERHRFQQGDLELKEAVTNISHDLRTPLTAICGYLDLLKREDKGEDVERYLAQIEDRVEALKRLTEELFRYSIVASTNHYTMEKIDLRRNLEESLIAFYGTMTQKGITPEINMPEERIERMLDSSAVNRIFSNIISNAVKYSEGDFSVTMDTDGKITFTNTAKGLNAVDVGKLFDRFYTVETGRKSTGLGLSIAKILTERMDGTIYAEYKDSKLHIIVHFKDM